VGGAGMHQLTRRWLSAVLAAVGLCAVSAETRGQDVRPTWFSADAAGTANLALEPGASTGSPIGLASTSEMAWLPADPAYSLAGSSDLAGEVAELRSEVEKLKAAQAKPQAVKYPTVGVAGRVFIDAANFSQNAASKAQAGDFLNGLEVRRTRVYLKGDVFPVVDYKLQFELASRTTIPDFPGVGQWSSRTFT
jgi:hypothetical protein